MGFKTFQLAKVTIDGIETAHLIRNGRLSGENIPVNKQLMVFAG